MGRPNASSLNSYRARPLLHWGDPQTHRARPRYRPLALDCAPKAVPGPAKVRAHSTLDDKSAGFTVAGTPVTTTTTKATTTTAKATTTTSSSTTTTSTTVAATTTTSSSSTTSTFFPTTTVGPVKTKKTSSHSDVPRYIAVALVVLAAAATAGVDTRLRRLRG